IAAPHLLCCENQGFKLLVGRTLAEKPREHGLKVREPPRQRNQGFILKDAWPGAIQGCFGLANPMGELEPQAAPHVSIAPPELGLGEPTPALQAARAAGGRLTSEQVGETQPE